MSENNATPPVRPAELYYDPFTSSGTSNITAFLCFLGMLSGAVVFLTNASLLWILVPVFFFGLSIANMVYGSKQTTEQFKLFSGYLQAVKTYIPQVSTVDFTDKEYLHLAHGDVVVKTVEDKKKDFFLDINEDNYEAVFVEDKHNPKRED